MTGEAAGDLIAVANHPSTNEPCEPIARVTHERKLLMLTLPKIEEKTGLNDFPVLYWNHVGLEMNRITHSLSGPQSGPTMSSRALGLMHLSMHDAYFAVLGASAPYPIYLPASECPALPASVTPSLDNANIALTAAAITILDHLYKSGGAGISIEANETLTSALSKAIADYQREIPTLSAAHGFGQAVAEAIFSRLGVKQGDIGADAGRYEPKQGKYKFRDEPVNPLRRPPIDPNNPGRGTRAQRLYHGPFYGTTVKDFAVTDPDGHTLAPPPAGDTAYLQALCEVIELGGAPGQTTTKRTPDQTVAALYWAYDGANLIGTPPRLYNQIARVIAWNRSAPAATELARSSEFVRLFALVNTAMADSGKYAWKEKYRHEFWRPLTGVREHDEATGSRPEKTGGNYHLDKNADPFWIALGAPETNTNRISFKPPFPAYPSGHATFGAAAFQMIRLFYKCDATTADDISFSFVSEELNGISRDLHAPFDPAIPLEDQPGIIRTRVVRRFKSLWQAIFENALSRIYLGVHWNFDAFDVKDLKGAGYENAEAVTYSHVWTKKRMDDKRPVGGVPLGLGIANDIFANQMKAPQQPGMPMQATPDAAKAPEPAKSTYTGIR